MSMLNPGMIYFQLLQWMCRLHGASAEVLNWLGCWARDAVQLCLSGAAGNPVSVGGHHWKWGLYAHGVDWQSFTRALCCD